MENKKRDLPSYIRHFVDQSATRIRPFVVNGNFNTEYIRGNQNIKISENLTILNKQYNDNQVYIERKVFNRMNPIFLTRFGILMDNMPIPGFKPSVNSHKTIMDAAKGNSFVKEFMADIDFKSKHAALITRADIFAVEWVRTGIDWSQGKDVARISVKTNGEDSDFILKEGRPFVELVSLHEVFVDNLNIDDVTKIQELVHRRVFTLEYIKAKWNIDAKREDVNDLLDGRSFSLSTINSGSNLEYAYVYEYYKKPDYNFKDGRHVITINNKIIYDGPLPYKNGFNGARHIPFDLIVMQKVPNHLMGMSIYPQLIPIQDTLNSIKNRYLEYVNHIAIGQFWYWEGSFVNSKQISTKPGKMMGLKRNARPPQMVQKDKLSNEFISYLRMLDEDMLITAGLSPLTTYGAAKSSMRTDGVADKVAESDQNKLVNAIENISNTYIQIFKKVMYLEKERQEIIKDKLGLAKKDSYVIKYKLDEVDIEQLTIVNREFLMRSDQIFDKKLQQANQMGLYNAELRLSYLSKLSLLDSINGGFLKDTLDPKERANHDLIETEHFQMVNDMEVQVERFHLHEQHIYEHDVFRLSPEMLVLKDRNPKKYDLLLETLEKHIEDHQKFVEQKEEKEVYNDAKATFQRTTL